MNFKHHCQASRVSTALYLQATRSRAESARQAAIAEAVIEFLNNDLLTAVSPEQQGQRRCACGTSVSGRHCRTRCNAIGAMGIRIVHIGRGSDASRRLDATTRRQRT